MALKFLRTRVFPLWSPRRPLQYEARDPKRVIRGWSMSNILGRYRHVYIFLTMKQIQTFLANVIQTPVCWSCLSICHVETMRQLTIRTFIKDYLRPGPFGSSKRIGKEKDKNLCFPGNFRLSKLYLPNIKKEMVILRFEIDLNSKPNTLPGD